MKPIHNPIADSDAVLAVVIPHKVNDLNETNSQLDKCRFPYLSVVIPHKVNDLNETNSQLHFVNRVKYWGCDSSQS